MTTKLGLPQRWDRGRDEPVPVPFYKTPDMALMHVKLDPLNLEYVKPDHQTHAMKMHAFRRDGLSAAFAAETTPEERMTHLHQNALSIHFILSPTFDELLVAVRQNGMALAVIPLTTKTTDEQRLIVFCEAVKQTTHAMDCIPLRDRSKVLARLRAELAPRT